MAGFYLLDAVKTNFCADSVEWCPIKPFELFFVCGTYQLNINDATKQSCGKSKRIGQIHLYEVTKDFKILLHTTVDTGAILDMKWCNKNFNSRCLLATANADGEIVIWDFVKDDHDNKCELNCCTKYSLLENEERLILSLDWSISYVSAPSSVAISSAKICTSDSKGIISLFEVTADLKLTLIHSWKSHEYEAWVATFNCWNDNVIYTGGDDCALKVHDIRQNSQSATIINKDHTAGVTSLRYNHLQEFILASGSYDECLKIWDTRNMKSSLSSLSTGGGIWRIKWHPNTANSVLIAAMYDGFHMINTTDYNSMNISCSCKEHSSIAYGVDICFKCDNDIVDIAPESHLENHVKSVILVTTCSFYDNQLRLSFIY